MLANVGRSPFHLPVQAGNIAALRSQNAGFDLRLLPSGTLPDLTKALKQNAVRVQLRNVWLSEVAVDDQHRFIDFENAQASEIINGFCRRCGLNWLLPLLWEHSFHCPAHTGSTVPGSYTTVSTCQWVRSYPTNSCSNPYPGHSDSPDGFVRRVRKLQRISDRFIQIVKDKHKHTECKTDNPERITRTIFFDACTSPGIARSIRRRYTGKTEFQTCFIIPLREQASMYSLLAMSMEVSYPDFRFIGHQAVKFVAGPAHPEWTSRCSGPAQAIFPCPVSASPGLASPPSGCRHTCLSPH